MKVRFTRNDITDIVSCIAKDNPIAARRVREAILSSIELIAARSFIGIKNARAPDLRSRLVGRHPYRVHYTIGDDELLVLHIRHTARQPFTGKSGS